MLSRITALVMLTLLIPLSAVQAQGSNSLTYGQTVAGTLTDREFRTVYTFNAAAGDTIDVILTRTDGDLDPVLILMDDQSAVIAIDDDSATGYDASLISVRLPRDGVYFLIVTRFGQEIGLTTGGYSLTLTRAGIAADSVGSDRVLRYGDSVIGELNNDEFQRVYIFTANRGDVITITMQRISGDLDSLLILADSQGNVLETNDEDPASPGTLDAAINEIRLPQSGGYVLVATRFGREGGASRGGFSLAISELGADVMGASPDYAIFLDFNTPETGTIDNNTVRRYYLLQVQPGAPFTINVERLTGNLDPTLQLYTEDMTPLVRHNEGSRGRFARITDFTPVSSVYILEVSRFNGDDGITTGTFSVTLSPLEQPVSD